MFFRRPRPLVSEKALGQVAHDLAQQRVITIQLKPIEVLYLILQLRLAARHPCNLGSPRLFGESLARGLRPLLISRLAQRLIEEVHE